MPSMKTQRLCTGRTSLTRPPQQAVRGSDKREDKTRTPEQLTLQDTDVSPCASPANDFVQTSATFHSQAGVAAGLFLSILA